MEFPVLRPSEIHRSTGQRFCTPHIIRSPFSNNRTQQQLQQQQQQQQGRPQSGQVLNTFNLLNGYAEDNEVLPFDDLQEQSEQTQPSSYWGGHSAAGNRASASSYRGSSRTGMIDLAYNQRPSSAVLWTSANSPGLTVLGLNFDEQARMNYLESIRTFGYDYMKPPGISKTMQAVLEEEEMSDESAAEESEFEEEEEVGEGVENDMSEFEEEGEEGELLEDDPGEGQAVDAAIGEEQEVPAEPEEVNLDDEIAEASDFEYNNSDEEDYNDQDFGDPFMVDEDYGEASEGEADRGASVADELTSSLPAEEDDPIVAEMNDFSDDTSSADDTFAERHGGGPLDATSEMASVGVFAAALAVGEPAHPPSEAPFHLPRARRSSRRAVSIMTPPPRHQDGRTGRSVSWGSGVSHRDSSGSLSASRRSSAARLSGRIVSSEYSAQAIEPLGDEEEPYDNNAASTPVQPIGTSTFFGPGSGAVQGGGSESESDMEVNDD